MNSILDIDLTRPVPKAAGDRIGAAEGNAHEGDAFAKQLSGLGSQGESGGAATSEQSAPKRPEALTTLADSNVNQVHANARENGAELMPAEPHLASPTQTPSGNTSVQTSVDVEQDTEVEPETDPEVKTDVETEVSTARVTAAADTLSQPDRETLEQTEPQQASDVEYDDVIEFGHPAVPSRAGDHPADYSSADGAEAQDLAEVFAVSAATPADSNQGPANAEPVSNSDPLYWADPAFEPLTVKPAPAHTDKLPMNTDAVSVDPKAVSSTGLAQAVEPERRGAETITETTIPADPAGVSVPAGGQTADIPMTEGADLPDQTRVTGIVAGEPQATVVSGTDTVGRALDLNPVSGSPAQGTAPSAAPATATPPSAPPPQAPVIIAPPSDIVRIVSETLATDGAIDQNTIEVQLDPPELGRVSIDFRFEGQSLQAVTITADTPEAIRRLREMHFELVQTLEQEGLSSQDMTFQQREHADRQFADRDFGQDRLSAAPTSIAPDQADVIRQVTRLPGGGVNLKL